MHLILQKLLLLRQNYFLIVSLCLTLYFSNHLLFGERSYFRLLTLRHEIEDLRLEGTILADRRVELEKRVEALRPSSVDPDLLEERARIMLGYHYPGEKLLFRPPPG